MSLKVVILGAGKLTGHLAPALINHGFELKAIYNRTPQHAARLHQHLKVPVFNDYQKLPNADLYIIAVTDDAISKVASELSQALGKELAVVHTSGATPGAILADYFKQFGVLYFLQSFSRDKDVDFSQIPVCIDGNHKNINEKLSRIAHAFSTKVYSINDEQRLHLHIAGVFVNNFVNHLYGLGQEVLEKLAIPEEILHPIILATAQKILEAKAKDVQTGPALRKDHATLERHLNALKDQPELHQIYQLITQQILKKY